MPKVSQTTDKKMKNNVREFGENVFSIANPTLTCKLCNTIVNSKKKNYVAQHIRAARHKKLKLETENLASTSQPVDIPPSLPNTDRNFHLDLCEAFI